MENSSQETPEMLVRFHSIERWYVDMIFTALLAALSLYVLCSLLYFQFMKRQKTITTNRHGNKPERRFATVTKTIGILVAVFSLLYDCVKLGMLSIEDKAYHDSLTNTTTEYLAGVCSQFPKVREITLVIGTGLVYLFLWARQRVFYINPSLKLLNSKLVRVLSYVVVVFWFVYFISLSILLLAIPRYIYLVPGGCFIHPDVTRFFQVLVGSLVIACAILQLTLLWLFINPLINRTAIRGFSANSGPSRSFKKIYSRVKRALILSLVSLLSDILTVVLVTVLHRDDTVNTTLPYSFNLVINMLATVGCYDNWKIMLLPWCADKRKVFRGRFVSSRTSHSGERQNGSTVLSGNNNRTNASQDKLSSTNDTLKMASVSKEISSEYKDTKKIGDQQVKNPEETEPIAVKTTVLNGEEAIQESDQKALVLNDEKANQENTSEENTDPNPTSPTEVDIENTETNDIENALEEANVDNNLGSDTLSEPPTC